MFEPPLRSTASAISTEAVPSTIEVYLAVIDGNSKGLLIDEPGFKVNDFNMPHHADGVLLSSAHSGGRSKAHSASRQQGQRGQLTSASSASVLSSNRFSSRASSAAYSAHSEPPPLPAVFEEIGVRPYSSEANSGGVEHRTQRHTTARHTAAAHSGARDGMVVDCVEVWRQEGKGALVGHRLGGQPPFGESKADIGQILETTAIGGNRSTELWQPRVVDGCRRIGIWVEHAISYRRTMLDKPSAFAVRCSVYPDAQSVDLFPPNTHQVNRPHPFAPFAPVQAATNRQQTHATNSRPMFGSAASRTAVFNELVILEVSPATKRALPPTMHGTALWGRGLWRWGLWGRGPWGRGGAAAVGPWAHGPNGPHGSSWAHGPHGPQAHGHIYIYIYIYKYTYCFYTFIYFYIFHTYVKMFYIFIS